MVTTFNAGITGLVKALHPGLVGDSPNRGTPTTSTSTGACRPPETADRLVLGFPSSSCHPGRMFERFSDDARRTVVLAQAESCRLAHRHIGAEHLLLALTRQDGTRVAGALLTAGITHARVGAEVERWEGRGQGPLPGHLPFTAAAKAILEKATFTASQRRHSVVTPEHLFLALLRESDEAATQVISGLGADPAALLAEATALVG
ncbi:hypothetical protein LWP59_25025 [Amycolatopsis acidiphila]|uniref:Clp R domain-containing protein n=1 Tax=Amycolatopsis acidiphila TaxID=715473 RepID=A0A558ALF0_9PSEU|nr:Clp protease N-terminal domain-containing protein [Amycolatopsis acidiphila]TVT25083.1 hypothetical protein FNH06_04510 [Amycolatopsis acidiphila]UIJ57405.1 hypothetical protein LWP59_25025 [Amycolatopsis acidiphila]GHG84404.1 hypothetical protein GCM10017788_56320 [Amycolatopsis acidiphila]